MTLRHHLLPPDAALPVLPRADIAACLSGWGDGISGGEGIGNRLVAPTGESGFTPFPRIADTSEAFCHTFGRPGSFIYVCDNHPLRDMTGRITVR